MTTKRKDAIEEAERHFAAGRIDRARAIVERALATNGDGGAAKKLAAAIALAEERWDAVLAYTDDASKDAWTHFARARALLGLGRLDDASTALVRSRDLDPSDPGIYELETMLLRAKDDLPGALAAIEGAIVLDPLRVSALAMKADVLLAIERDEEAFDVFRAAVRSRSEDPRAHAKMLLHFAQILESRGKTDEATMARTIAKKLAK
jgi:tetratricopeptide (TPR) repeat protein